ncbi:uncharacterized protein LOC110048245 [Orbicella faveolata]|uniref:uncharacterized protein LOC110048245 n=1 Tax=Orbicella faveolata TaxID=48498 RepID=UPI0009E5D599|nr:uncharacterized protein LOC110048245 [Orbicella faveolata]
MLSSYWTPTPILLKLFRSTLISSYNSVRVDIHGGFDGPLNPLVANAELKASLDKLSSECNDVSDITIQYYATDMPDKLPTTLEDLESLIDNFPSRLERINNGRGIPMKFELLPTKDIIPIATAYIQQRVSDYKMEELENRFDDLRNARTYAKRYLESVEETGDDIQRFISKVNEHLRDFYSAISALNKSEGQELVDACLDAYKQALDGYDVEGKFVRRWNKILSTKVSKSCIYCLDIPH